jgi:hypothetical protein
MSLFGDNITVGQNVIADIVEVSEIDNKTLDVNGVVIFETEWNDSNADGLADGWISNYGNPTVSESSQKVFVLYYTGIENYIAEIQINYSLKTIEVLELEVAYKATKEFVIKEATSNDVIVTLPASEDFVGSVKVDFQNSGSGLIFRLDGDISESDYFQLFKVSLKLRSVDNFYAN